MSNDSEWPPLPLNAWRETYATLHMWTQIVGKVCLALTPRTNHFWNIAFRLTSRGLSTPMLSIGQSGSVEITFNFIDRRLEIDRSDGASASVALAPRTVADFYGEVMAKLAGLGIDVKIWPMPVEVPDPIRFDQDTVHHSYDAVRAEAFWRALLAMKPVFEEFRCGFVGKCSPLHFFWGSFDLALTRFSGRRAPDRPEADAMTKEAYSHEVISHGFWPGSGAIQEAAFYSYAAPEPPGFSKTKVRPASAFYSEEMHLFILPYEAVRSASSPEAEIRAFLESTYEAGVTLAGWNRPELERVVA